jgi:hypothetical protein
LVSALLHLQQIYSKISLSGCKIEPIGCWTNRPVSKEGPLFLLFLQEIISEGPLLRRRNPRLSEARQSKQQRDDARIPAASLLAKEKRVA